MVNIKTLSPGKYVFLQPGQIFLSSEGETVGTILGSCVSVTFYNRILKMGSICHSLLPESQSTDESLCGKYIECSVRRMVRMFQERMVNVKTLEVKLFGGSILFGHNNPDASVGSRNVRAAYNVLDKLGFRITASDVGGELGRKIFFNLETGKVIVKKIKKQYVPANY